MAGSGRTSGARGRAVRRRRSRQHGPGPPGHGLGLRVLLALLVAAAAYAAYLDVTVRARFEGARWALPARIYARALEIYPGLGIAPGELVAELESAGYHRVSDLRRPGSYRRHGGRFEIATRAFAFPDGHEPARRLRVELHEGRVTDVRDPVGPVPIARLDPALIGRVYPGHREDRILISLEDAPPVLVAGLLAVEDRRFFEHHGVSPRAILRALWANVRAGQTVQGGSTLTQQLAKNLYLGPERTLWRKLNEAAIAVLLELRYSKRALLEAYLNEVYLGQEGDRAIHGFGLAARFYFERRLDELDPHELALLIGLVRGASLYNPRRQPARARARRDLVLDVMSRESVLERSAARRAKTRPLGVTPNVPKGASPHPAFLDLVRAQLARDYHDHDLRTAGLQVFTSLDPVAQRTAEEGLRRRLGQLEARRGLPPGLLQGAVVAVHPASGEVVAVVGDRHPRALGFNRAVRAVRPIGSLAKPVVYLAALERPARYHLASRLSDRPLTLEQPGQPPWRPRNYDGTHRGSVTLVEALATSNNLATVRLGLDLGLDVVTDAFHRLGVARPVPRVPSVLLGSVALTPIEVAQMYQPLANDGFRAPLRAIREVTGARGEPLARYGLRIEQASSSQAVFLLRHALERVIAEGTGRAVRRALPPHARVAGKTGTTDELRDSWFAGFSEDLLVVVWIGRDDNRPAELTGSAGALQVWADILPRLAHRYLGREPVAGVEWRWTDLATSRLVPEGGPGGCTEATVLPYRRGVLPPVGERCGVSAIATPEEEGDALERADQT